MSGMDDSIKVAVRVRPFSQRERQGGGRCIVKMHGPSTTITHPVSGEARTFAFDHSYWSHDGFTIDSKGIYVGTDDRYADQGRVFRDLGRGILSNALEGYNAALFAYGQTGSGKSYSMIGYGNNRGIVPIACDELFQAIKERRQNNIHFQVTFSMLEIYNEQVRDLLVPPASVSNSHKARKHQGLRVRQNPATGFYVQGLKKVAVQEYGQIEQLMEQGTRHRTTASTNMNATSSRSHMVITITFKQIYKNSSGESTTKSSEMSLVDLAGSERADSSGATGDRLKEGSNINQSLSTLGKVISALADMSSSRHSKVVVPYRDSVLTKLLQSALGGNSKTIMIAALSPAASNYEETLSTLRYADRAKRIKNKAVINENPSDKMIRELKEENNRLMQQLRAIQEAGGHNTGELEERLERNLAEMDEAEERSWEHRLLEARREWELSQISTIESNRGFADNPYLINVNEDPQLSGVIKHCLPMGESKFGKAGDKELTVELRGLRLQSSHCKIVNTGSHVTIAPCTDEALINVNGNPVRSKTRLKHMDRIQLGSSNLYLFVGFPSDRTAHDDYTIYDYDFFHSELAEACGLSSDVMLNTPRLTPSSTRHRTMHANGDGTARDEALESGAMMQVFQDYVDLLPKIDQVNAMSEDMDKGVVFEAEVKNLASYDATGQSKDKEVVVRVTNTYINKVWIWSTGKFINRKFLIEELYGRMQEEDGDIHLPPHQDPFWDPVEDILLGTCHLWLHNMAYCLDSEDRLEIVDDRGEKVAKLQAKLIPCDKRGRTLQDEKIVFDPEELLDRRFDFIVSIPQVSGIRWCQNDPTRGAYCQFYFFHHEHPQRTVSIQGSTEPTFKYKKQLTEARVTKDFLQYLQTHAIVIELWATQSDDSKIKRQKSAAAKDKALSDAMQLIAKLEEKIKRQDTTIQQMMVKQDNLQRENAFFKHSCKGLTPSPTSNGAVYSRSDGGGSYLHSPSSDTSEASQSRRSSSVSMASVSTTSSSQETAFEAEVAKSLKVFFRGTKRVHRGLDDIRELNLSMQEKNHSTGGSARRRADLEHQLEAIDSTARELEEEVNTMKTAMMDLIRKKRQNAQTESGGR